MEKELKAMIDTIALEARDAQPWVGKADIESRVIAAMSKIPRHEFVSSSLVHAAYEDGPLPIGYGQTISQPYIVALMTDLLRPKAEDVVLEVGTGSGYQAAVLSLLVSRVYSIEIIQALAEEAASRLKRLGYNNIEVRWGDGYHGWPEHGPYDGIIVTAAGREIPQPLVDQLKPGGRLVMPMSDHMLGQELILVEKDPQGHIHKHSILPVAFVPLTRVPQASEAESGQKS